MSKKVAPPEGADDVSAKEVKQADNGLDPAKYKQDGRLKSTYYDTEIAKLQEQLVLLQYWIQSQGLKVAVIFEGRGSAGKGGVIKRINDSQAGVSASYDSANDRFLLTNKATGDLGMALEDVTGNFLAATGLSSGTLTRGNDLLYTVNGGGTIAVMYGFTNGQLLVAKAATVERGLGGDGHFPGCHVGTRWGVGLVAIPSCRLRASRHGRA